MKGASKMIRKLTQFAQRYPDHVAAALYQEGQTEMTEAKRRTPVDVNYTGGRKPPHPGQLRASGRVHQPVRQGRNISVTLSFGGAAVDYAVWVHELIDNLHPVGQAKYLESTLNESAPHMAERLARRVHLNKTNVS
jgi:hypothetical protein